VAADRQDYIRAGTVCEDNANLLITGSYDHTVKLWDVRSGECTLTINQGSPVESLLVFPGASAIITAGASSSGTGNTDGPDGNEALKLGSVARGPL